MCVQALADEMVGQLERLLSTAGLSVKHCTALGCQYVEVLARYAVHSMTSAAVCLQMLQLGSTLGMQNKTVTSVICSVGALPAGPASCLWVTPACSLSSDWPGSPVLTAEAASLAGSPAAACRQC